MAAPDPAAPEPAPDSAEPVSASAAADGVTAREAAEAAGLDATGYQELRRFLLGRGLGRERLAEAIQQLAQAAAGESKTFRQNHA